MLAFTPVNSLIVRATGLIVAMFVTLLVVPVIYIWLGGGGAAKPRSLDAE